MNPFADVKEVDLVAEHNGEYTEVPAKGIFVNGKCVSVVSKDYVLVKNEQAYRVVQEAINLLGYKGQVYSQWFNGKRYHSVLELNAPISISEKDVINPCVHIFNSYDRSMALSIAINGSRVICTNYLFVENPKVLKVIHYTERYVEWAELAAITIKEGIENFRNHANEYWKKLYETKIDAEQAEQLISSVEIPNAYNEKVLELIKNEFKLGRPVTLWRMLNAYSYVISSPKAKLNGHTAVAGFAGEDGRKTVALNPSIDSYVWYLRNVDNTIKKMLKEAA